MSDAVLSAKFLKLTCPSCGHREILVYKASRCPCGAYVLVDWHFADGDKHPLPAGADVYVVSRETPGEADGGTDGIILRTELVRGAHESRPSVWGRGYVQGRYAVKDADPPSIKLALFSDEPHAVAAWEIESPGKLTAIRADGLRAAHEYDDLTPTQKRLYVEIEASIRDAA